MNKNEYLRELEKRLSKYSNSFKQDILEAFEGHFEDGRSEGKSDEEIIDELGSLDEVMENIRMMATEEDIKEEKPSFINMQYDSKNPEKNHFDVFGVSLEETLKGAADIIKSGIEAASEASYSPKEPLDLVTLEGMENCNCVEIESKEKADVNVVLQHGDTLAYAFEPSNSIFFGTSQAQVYASVLDHVLQIDIVGKGNGTLTVFVSDKVQDVEIKLLSGDIRCNDVSIQSVVLKTLSGDIMTKQSDFVSYLVDTKSGDIKVSDSDASEFVLNTASGDISLSRLHGDIKANTSSGDVSTDKCGSSESILTSKSGDVDWNGSCDDLSLSTMAGDIEITHKGSFKRLEAITKAGDIDASIESKDYTAQLSTVVGDIENETGLPTYMMGKMKGVVGNGTAKVLLKTVAGDIELSD